MNASPCTECHGTGKHIIVRRVSGEAIDADWIERRCEHCSGSGTVDPVCGCCEGRLDARGWCAGCEEYGDGPWTEVHPDPLKELAA